MIQTFQFDGMMVDIHVVGNHQEKEKVELNYVPWIDSISGSQVILNFTVPTIETFKLK